jgi:hypothetical protein
MSCLGECPLFEGFSWNKALKMAFLCFILFYSMS